jgi:hypothetical protein
MSTPLLNFALELDRANLCVIPIKPDGSKSPSVPSWKTYQRRKPTLLELQSWFGGKYQPGFAIIAGKVSDNLEIIDIDAPELIPQFLELVHEAAPDLMAKLVLVETPTQGLHIYYRCPVIEGNQKLAMSRIVVGGAGEHDHRGKPHTAKQDNGEWVIEPTAIETRGEGGYALTVNSPARCHKSGKPYTMLRGQLTAIPVITEAERAVLLDCARSFNQVFKTHQRINPVPAPTNGHLTPGQRFNQSGKVRDLLERHGWKYLRPGPNGELWARPGVDHTSATLYPDGGLYVFSSNASPLDSGRVYAPFSLYGILEHGGDFKKAAHTLGQYLNGQAEEIELEIEDADAPNNPQPQPTGADSGQNTTGGRKATHLAKTCGELLDALFTEGEVIAFGLERGEVGTLNALPNAGKTTLALNISIKLAIGEDFAPVVVGNKPRRVLFVDGETRARRLQRDLEKLLENLADSQKQTVRDNLHFICEGEIKGQALSLTDANHLTFLQKEILRIKPDFVVLDTLASLFHVYNENDNAEANRKVWGPLQKTARQTDAAFLVTHHIGKRQSEEGATPDSVYAGRGASSGGAAPRAVWNITVDPVTSGLITLKCAKVKGKTPANTLWQIDDSRWFRPVGQTQYKTTYDHLLEVVTEEMSRKEIVDAMKGVASGSTVASLLNQALHKGHLAKAKRGRFAPIKNANS